MSREAQKETKVVVRTTLFSECLPKSSGDVASLNCMDRELCTRRQTIMFSLAPILRIDFPAQTRDPFLRPVGRCKSAHRYREEYRVVNPHRCKQGCRESA